MKRITLTLPAPYVGLRPFTETEALVFFGRDAHVSDLLAKLEGSQRFLAVLGASGTGKSSLVRAGLIPALHRGGLLLRQAASADLAAAVPRWNVCIFKPGDAPLAHLANALTEDARWADNTERSAAEASLGALLGASPLALANLYRQKAGVFRGEALLLVVDQFEEIFRFRQRNPDEADSFVKLLLRSASEDVPIYIVMTMRSDFLGNAVAFHGLAEAINSGIYLTPRLGAEQIASVITSPLSLVGGTIDPVLANRLVNTLGGEDELPVLEHALLRMWDRARSEGRSSIEAGDFAAVCAPREQAGEPLLAFAIDNHASEIYDALTPFQRGVARQLFLSLVERREGRDVRRPQSVRELRSHVGNDAQEALDAVIDAFRAENVGFVLPAAPQRIAPDDLIDISHESLIRRWHRFQTWLAEEDLDVAELKEWQQRAQRRRESGGWLDEDDCERATRWRARVNDRTHPGHWAARYEGPSAYEWVDEYIKSSMDRLNEAKDRDAALKQEAEQERTARLEAEARLQRDAAQHERERREAIEHDRARLAKLRNWLFGVVGGLVFLLIATAWFAVEADRQTKSARAATVRANQLRLLGEIPAMLTGARAGGDERALQQLLALRATMPPSVELDGAMLLAVAARPGLTKIVDVGSSILSVDFSADGSRIVSGDRSGIVRLWDAKSLQPIGAPLAGHRGRIISVAFSPDGTRIISSSTDDNTLRLWDARSGQPIGGPLAGHEGPLRNVVFSPDGSLIVSGEHSGVLRRWDGRSGQPIGAPLVGHKGPVKGVAFSPSGSLIASGGEDGVLRLWDAKSGQQIGAPFMGHKDSVLSVAFSPDGSQIVSGGKDGATRLWNAKDGRMIDMLLDERGDGWIAKVAFSRDGSRILSYFIGGKLELWDTKSRNRQTNKESHNTGGDSVVFSPDGAAIVSGGLDGALRMLSSKDGLPIRAPLEAHKGIIWSVAFSPDGSKIVSGGQDGTLRLLPAKGGNSVGEWLQLVEHGIIKSVAFSPDGARIVSVEYPGVLRQWNGKNGQPIGPPLKAHKDSVATAVFSPDGARLISSGSADGELRSWDATSGQPIGLPLAGHKGSGKISPDGSRIVSLGEDDAVGDLRPRLWGGKSGSPIDVPLTGHEGKVESVAFSSDGSRIVTGGRDGTLRLWDSTSGKPIGAPLRGHTNTVYSVAFSRDGSRIVSGGGDTTVRQWDARSGQPIGPPMRGHQIMVQTVAFSPDRAYIVSGDISAILRLWDAKSGQPIGAPSEDSRGAIRSVAFSPDGTRIVSGGDAGLRLWPGPNTWADLLCAKLTRNMTREQWKAWISPDIDYKVQCPELPVPP